MELAPYMDSIVWLCVTILFIVIEVISVGFFFMFFAIGAAAAGLLALVNHNYLLQGFVFVGVSTVALIYAKPIIKKCFGITGEPKYLSNSGALVNQEVLILEPVKQYEGRVKVAHTGEVWTAYLDPESGVDCIEENAVGVVSKIDGAKLCVRPKL